MAKQGKKIRRPCDQVSATQAAPPLQKLQERSSLTPTPIPFYPPAGLSESFLNALYNGLSEAVLTVELETRLIVYWNKGAEAMFGYAAEEVVGQTTELLYPDSAAFQQIREVSSQMIRAHGHWSTEGEYQRRDGSRFWAEVTWTMFLQTKTYGDYLVTVIRDVTERKRMLEKIRESERLAVIGTTVAKLAHEIANPLNGMAITIQILEQYLAKQHDAVDEVLSATVLDLKQETNRLHSLLQELRAFARPRPLNLHETDLVLVATEALKTQAAQYAEKGIHIEQIFPTEFPCVIADSEKIAQVLLNLYKNAAEAMPKGGTLTVRGEHSKTYVSLEVRDTGEGIPPGVAVFEPFVTTKVEGTGLGLAIVQQIIEAHSGSVSYMSVPGQGTVFQVVLPVNTSSSASKNTY
jgi:PAS domain S-box-containing protein